MLRPQTGMAIGALSTIIPNYNAEIAPPEVRGSLVSMQQLAITAGIMVSFWINYGTNYIGGTGSTQSDAAWLVPICLQLIPGLILGVGMPFMPFSPRWLVGQGRDAEARQILSNLRNLDENHELLELEYLEVKAQAEFDKRTVAANFPGLEAPTWTNTAKLQFLAIASLFKSKAMFRRVIIAGGTMFFQVRDSKEVGVGYKANFPFPAIYRYQRRALLRTQDFRSVGSLRQHDQPPSHRCRRHCHVSVRFPSIAPFDHTPQPVPLCFRYSPPHPLSSTLLDFPSIPHLR